MIKRFIAAIYLFKENAVTDLKDRTVLNDEPIKLASFYAGNGADELLIFDLSNNDEEQQKALGIIKEIAGKVAVPVIGAGNITRLEDVKKLLYSGCRMVALNFAKASNVRLAEEAAARFGKEKIAACAGQADEIIANEEILKAFVSEVIIVNEHLIRPAGEIGNLPLIIHTPKISLDKIIELLTNPVNVAITGNAINHNSKELFKIKDLCRENGIALTKFTAALDFSELTKSADGLVPVIVQENSTNEVLMLAYMNEESFHATLKSGRMTYYSRSRKSLWVKGETSGHYQYVRSLAADCDKDTFLARVTQLGAACHTGSHNCFIHPVIAEKKADAKNPAQILETVLGIINDRKLNPKEGSYTNYLFDKGLDKILKKMGEEATEIVIAAKNPNPNEIKYEIADYLYHLMVLMAEKGLSWEEIMDELAKR